MFLFSSVPSVFLPFSNMSRSGGGGGGESRVSIPADLRKTIQSIREITGKQHSDEDIYAVFNDCFHDPHETAQKLLYLDTFHEVKSKRDRRKENSFPISQGRGMSGQRNYSSNHASSDFGGGRNAASRRKNGGHYGIQSSKSSLPVPLKPRNSAVPHASKVSNGLPSLSNGVTSHKSEDSPTDVVKTPVIAEEPFSQSTSGSDTKAIDSEMPMLVEKNESSELQSSIKSRNDSSDFTSNHGSQSLQVVKRDVDPSTIKTKSQLLPESVAADRPSVTFPLHFQVAKALKNGLTFGSFDSDFEMGTNCVNGTSEGDSLIVESSHGGDNDVEDSSPETNEVVSSPSQIVPTNIQDNDLNNSQSAPVSEQVPESDHVIPPGEGDGSEGNGPKQEAILSSEGHQIPTFQNVPSYGIGLMPILSASQPVQSETNETQIGNSGAPASSNLTSTGQNSVAALQQSIPLFRQPLPPNFFPYGPYLSPFYLPHIQQFLGPNGLPQQSYLPPGVRLPFSQFKPGTNVGNSTPVGIPSAYGSYGSSPVVFDHVPSATSISSSHNEDLVAAQLKENIYTTAPQTNNLPAWMPANGQNLSNLQVNSLYNLPLPGQHLAFSPLQAGHGGFPGIYHPTQIMVAPSTPNQPLQQSHAIAPTSETVGPPPVAYHQPQLAQSNWNTN